MSVSVNTATENIIIMTGYAVRDALLALPESDRKFIITDPAPGEHKIYSIRRNTEGNPEYDYNVEPES